MSGHLKVLDMQHNYLSGTLSTTFSIASVLRSFNLHDNELEGKIFISFANCKELQVLNLEYNHLIDIFPIWLEILPMLQALNLRSNSLHGLIRSLKNENMLPKHRIMDLSCNAFSKNLPMSLFQCLKAMKVIDRAMKSPSCDADIQRRSYTTFR
ncbi:hypothetical protein HAX54_045171, partial [Datura stramonium]|nr:hypothetical protein [Datura stramonium]